VNLRLAPVALWHRPPGRRNRWRVVGRFATRRDALAAIAGPGDWWIGEPSRAVVPIVRR
jgi:hypothetical protein